MSELIGSLLVRIGADTEDLIKGLGGANTALGKTGQFAAEAAQRMTLIAGAAAAVGAAVFAMAKNIADAADQLGKLSQKVGISVESLSALKYAADISEVSLDGLSIGLKQLAKHMQETQAGTGDASAAFRALHIDVEQSRGQLKPTEDVLLALADRFSRMEDGAGKTALAMRIFGKSGNDLIPFLNQGRDGLAALRAEAEKFGVIISTEASKQATEFNENLKRLETQSKGLAIEMSGPLIKALGQVTMEMVNARKEGDGFFATLQRGFMATRPDSYRIDKDIVEATDRFLDAQKALDNVRYQAAQAGNTPFDVEQVKRFEKEVANAKAEVERLMKIKGVLLPPEAPKSGADNKPKTQAPALPKSTQEQEADARRLQQAFEDEQKTVTEAMDVTSAARNKQLGEEKDNYDARLKALYDFIDADQEAQIQAGEAEIKIREQTMTEAERFERSSYQARAQFLAGWFSDTTAIAARSNKKMFEINKTAAVADALIKGYGAVISSYKFGADIGGPIVGAAMAALAAAATAIQIRAIGATQYGGGGSVPASVSGSAVATPVSVAQQPAAPQSSQTTVVRLEGGDIFTRKQVRGFLQMLSEEQRDGGRIVVAG